MVNTFSKNSIELSLTLAIFAVALLFFNLTQPPISYNTEPLLDAHQYSNGYLFFNHEVADYSVKFPYNTRVGTPFLASLLPYQDSILSFKIIITIHLFISVVVLFFCLSGLRLSLVTRLVFWSFLLFHWLGPVRYLFHEPIQVDTACYWIYGFFLLILIHQKHTWLYVLSPVSVVFKESLLPFIAIAAVYHFYKKEKKEGFQFLLSLALGWAMLYLLRYFFPPAIEHWQHHGTITILRIFKMILLNPTILLRWLASLFTTFGLVLIFHHYSKIIIDHLSVILLLTAIGLGLIAGGDHSRLIFTGIPFLLLFLKDYPLSNKQLLFFILFSLPFFHLFSTIPDITEMQMYESWHPEYASFQTLLLIFVYSTACYFVSKIVAKTTLTLPTKIRKKL